MLWNVLNAKIAIHNRPCQRRFPFVGAESLDFMKRSELILLPKKLVPKDTFPVCGFSGNLERQNLASEIGRILSAGRMQDGADWWLRVNMPGISVQNWLGLPVQ